MTSSQQVAERPAVAGRLPSLTGMRFLCAAMVFGLHSTLFGFFSSTSTAGKYSAAVDQGGFTGVVYFFILSGFVLTWSARAGDRVGAFWRRRFVKIYPSYLVALAGGVVFAALVRGSITNPVIAQTSFFSRIRILLDVLLVQSWAPNVAVRTSYNAPLWSLSAEALFYLAFPLLLILISRIRPAHLWAWTGGVVALIFAVPAVAHTLPPGQIFPGLSTTGTEVWLDVHFPATCLLEFVLGILTARIVMTGRRLPMGLGGAVAFSIAAYWLTTYVPTRFDAVAIMVVPLALLIATAAVQDSAGRPTLVSHRVWVKLGEISFAFYLLHYLILMIARQLLGARTFSSPTAFALLAALFLVTLGLSYLLHTLVEQPMMNRFARSRRSKAAIPEAAPEYDAVSERQVA